MARRKKRRFGAVTGKKYFPEGFARSRSFDVRVSVMRGAGTYVANACPKWGSHGPRKGFMQRCGEGKGRTVTAATASALRNMASKLK